MAIPTEVRRLVERFGENREAYLSREYNETQLRREFLDPFFKALGWDVDNERGYAEAYKDVVHEDAIKIERGTKAPDYAFRIGGTRKFFVEAKRPSVGIKDNPDAAYQLRRYAWSAKLALSILTDFEEFAVYDTRVRPNRDDKASTARTFYFTCEEYAEKWDEISAIFSPDAIRKGSFDRYVETKRMRGTAEVDDAFLKEIEGWRDVLARNIALRNAELSNREVNFAVQRTIDRIIFLRICEDRGIEEYGQLMALQNGTQIYRRLCEVFHRADDRYNSGLFHFRKEKDRGAAPDELTLGLEIDDKVFKEIFKALYYPESPYEFSVLPADILGHIYEQFLGKVIRLTGGHRAVIEEKPEVRKAGGVYYTPTYIVDYIVEHTVGKLLEGKTPTQVAKLRVLDPACGSGSFLLGAYQQLLDWHLAWYAENDPEKHAKGRNPRVYRAMTPSPPVEESPSAPSASTGAAPSSPSPSGKGPRAPSPSGSAPVPPSRSGRASLFPSPSGRGQGEGAWRLTTAEKKRILLNNIYGVDIDPQAVEVTKLSLLLKVLEGESEETLGKTLRMFHERALPDLGENIKCGNSLIGPDFYEGKQLSLIDEEERYRINAFDWHAEFPEIFSSSPALLAGEGPSSSSSPPGRAPSPPSPPGRAPSSPSPAERGPSLPSPSGRGQGEGGGFDAVIGNPPYIRIQAMKEWAPIEVEFYKQRYTAASKGNYDIYVVFVERALQLLNKSGRMGFILPHKFFQAKYGEPLRSLIAEGRHLGEVVHFGDQQVFPRASTYTCLLFLAKEGSDHFSYWQVRDLGAWQLDESASGGDVEAERASSEEWAFVAGAGATLLERLAANSVGLEDVTDRIFQGLKTGADKVFIARELMRENGRSKVASPADGTAHWIESELLHPLVKGGEIRRYALEDTDRVILFPYQREESDRTRLIDSETMQTSYPLAWCYLEANRSLLEQRERGKMKGARWYAFSRDQAFDVVSTPKILTPDIAVHSSFALDEAGTAFFTGGVAGGYGILVASEHSRLYILALLNSRLLEWYIRQTSTQMRGGYYSYEARFIRRLPICVSEDRVEDQYSLRVKTAESARALLALKRAFFSAKTEHEATSTRRQIDATDRQIDQLVYELYGLTDKEIRIVEDATSR